MNNKNKIYMFLMSERFVYACQVGDFADAVGTIKENELFLIIEGPCGYLGEEYKILTENGVFGWKSLSEHNFKSINITGSEHEQ